MFKLKVFLICEVLGTEGMNESIKLLLQHTQGYNQG